MSLEEEDVSRQNLSKRLPHLQNPSFWASFLHAANGIGYAWRSQRNMRVHVLATALVGLAVWGLRLPPTETAVVILAVILVIGTEMINTAIETVVNMVSPEYRESARIAKDVAAGAVLVASIGAVLVGCCIIVPHLTWPEAGKWLLRIK